ncbi:right-handed parallel beta-helix repeat-containing protein [Micromonospora rifamycinica]|uniref:right-handed parallel beta-helix repeat-containing protein n=1 Tax=Micromonospora rifamycinica TaxID=291594 RepID=UPI0033E8E2B5
MASFSKKRVLTLLAVTILAASLTMFPSGADAPAWAREITATCDNTTSDDETLNRVIAGSAPGDEIVIDGPCLINDTIKLLGERSYRGRSRAGTVIRQADGANLPVMLASDSYLDNDSHTGMPVSIRSISLDGRRTANPRAGDVLVMRSWQSVVEDVEIIGAARHAIRLTNLSANGTPLANTQVNGRVVGNHIGDSGGRAVFVEDTGNSVTDWQLLDNWIADSGTDAIALENAAGWIIQRNHIYGTGRAAITAERLFGSTISDNYIEDFVTVGLQGSIQGEASSTISGNRIFRFNGGGGTFLSLRTNYGTGNIVVVGNAIRGNGTGVGIDYGSASGTGLSVVSTGNLVTGVTTPRRTASGVTLSTGV